MNGSSHPTVAVIGAGIVGTTTALDLLRAGFDVTLIDAQPAGSGASFGNAGMISPDSPIPLSVPGVLCKVPGFLMDPLGPLAIRPSYFLTALPWLLKWASECRFDRVLATSDAMRSLQLSAFNCYRELLGQEHFADLIKVDGQIYYWEGEGPPLKEPIRDAIYERHGVIVEALDLRELRRLVPALTPAASHAILLPKNGHTVNPQRLVQTIAALFIDAGGTSRQENVLKVMPEGSGYRLITGVANHLFDKIVVAAGAWSQRLLAPLGYRFPLETERGYHITIPRPNIQPPVIPVLCLNTPAGVSPLDGGLRCAGTDEFAGLDAPMNEKRATIMLRTTQNMLPGLNIDDYSIWMGHRPSLPDSLPIIDYAPNHKGLFLAFGHAHAGMTSAPLTGRLITELIAGRQPSIDVRPFRATRF
jgi:glycine/D-amino acid oxidase-like deaminating enzyme